MGKNKVEPLLVIPYTPGAARITEEQGHLLFSDQELAQGEQRGELRTIGPWQMPIAYKALAVSCVFDRTEFPVRHGPLHVYGTRVLNRVRQSGHELEGRVSVGGRSYRGFTSSQLFNCLTASLLTQP